MDKNHEYNEGHIEGRCQDMMGCAKDRLYDEKERLADNAAKAENSMKDKGSTLKARVSDAADSARESVHKAGRVMRDKFD